MSNADPKVIIQAHVLRTAAAREAMLYGTSRPRSPKSITKAVLGSAALGALAIVVAVIALRISDALS